MGRQQRMWPGPKAEPIALPAAIAQRRIIRGTYLEEVMLPADERPDQPGAFVRSALFNYNAVTARYEYTSLHTRASQLMVERSAPVQGSSAAGEVKLQVGSFAAPEWGSSKNVRQDFHLYYITRYGLRPSKVAFLAWHAWRDPAHGLWPPNFPDEAKHSYSVADIKKWLAVFLYRFFEISQYKRSALPNGPKVVSGGSLSPRGDWRAPSDGNARVWLDELELNVPGES